MCRSKGLLVAANEVDHIIPLCIGGERLDPANLQCLCRPCHQQKTREDKRKGWTYKGDIG